ncbi:MAG: methylated-DNA--[protein]-cysteine S-methyltransferase [Alphaproteobacteria bacterium]|nr:methylated-DNA--[protein]-cysteine S-methyltransferase [Alphaproteobacteria bacterium]
MPFANDHDRWAALVERDVNADRKFYYSVATTGVYCKPSCAARLARRENVAFHATPADAERAGFRPCKRCRPSEAIATIRFAVGACSLGAILVAATDKGVCAILLDDDAGALARDLQDRFPMAQLIGGDASCERLVAKVVGFVEAPARGLDLPLDIRGTAFQQRVWSTLREIPAGETVSYSAVAERIGSPQSVRAVAGACAANAIAVAIPCHRVVRSDGGLSGYRWGIERKQSLLEREADS